MFYYIAHKCEGNHQLSMKSYISNLVRTTLFWINLDQVKPKSIGLKAKSF